MNRRWVLLPTLAALTACTSQETATPPGPATESAVVEPPPVLRCQGNEPFWNLRIEGGRAIYRTLEGGEEGRIFSGGFESGGDANLLEWRGAAADDPATELQASIREERCLDTMSDETPPFPYVVLLRPPTGDERRGCCRADEGTPREQGTLVLDELPVADLSAAGPDDWTRLFHDLRPAIEGCLGQSRGSVARVTKAWPMNHGRVGVRLRDDAGGRFDCLATSEGEVERFRALDPAADRVPGEGRVVFTPAAEYPPSGECWEHERLLDAAGELVGWLSHDTC